MGMNRGLLDKIITPVTFLFFVFNILFLILGITSLALGVIALLDNDSLETFTLLDKTGTLNDIKVAGFIKYVSMGLVGMGAALLVIGFMGCCGAGSGLSFCIYLYSVILFLLVLAQLGSFGFIYMNKDSLISLVEKSLKDGVKKFQGESYSTATDLEKTLILIQKYFSCCGVNGGEDYRNSPWFVSDRRSRGELVPVSCCKLKDVSNNIPADTLCQFKSASDQNPFTNSGCHDKLVAYFFDRGVITVLICSSIMIFQLLAICYAVIIERSFADDDVAAKLVGMNA